MTDEKLKEAKELAEKIQELESFLKAFHEPGMKEVVVYKVRENRPVTLSIEAELCEIIDGHLKQQLAALKKKFEEM